MKLNRKTLLEVGEALYGPSWHAPLADDLDVALRTMQRWAAGKFDIPAGIWPEIADIAGTRGTRIKNLATNIRLTMLEESLTGKKKV